MSLSDINEVEQRIVKVILDEIAAMEQPVTVRILSDDVKDFLGDFDRAAIESHIGNCETTEILVIDGEAKFWIELVHGNEGDLISNSGGNGLGYPIGERICDLAIKAGNT